MKEKKKDRDIVKDAVGDPAFYNDQIAENREPVKAFIEHREEHKKKKNK